VEKPGERRNGIFIFSAPFDRGGGVSFFHRRIFLKYRQEGNHLWGMFHLKCGVRGGTGWDFAVNCCCFAKLQLDSFSPEFMRTPGIFLCAGRKNSVHIAE